MNRRRTEPSVAEVLGWLISSILVTLLIVGGLTYVLHLLTK